MNPKFKFTSPKIAALAIVTATVFFTSSDVIAQSTPSSKEKPTTWQDWGYNQLPKGLSTDIIPLFEGLNESRGTWSFKGETTDGQSATPLQGNLSIQGNPKGGMIPMWTMDWAWPAKDPEQTIGCIVMASPNKSAFELALIRIGPLNPKVKKMDPGVQRTMFKGTWDLKTRTITWAESGLPGKLGDQLTEKDSAKPKQSFEMVVAAEGTISIQNSKHMPRGQLVNGKAIVRTGKAPAEAVALTGKHSFKTVAEISDRRIRPWLPPQATDISLLSERGGHYARYKVEEDHFMKFLDGLWEADKGRSAHKRGEFSEGEISSPESTAKRLKTLGQEPLGNFRTYYSPSKGSSAMTTYCYDRESGIVYHNRGYW